MSHETLRTLAYRRISVHESAVVVRFVRTGKRIAKGMERTLDSFGIEVRYISSSASWVRITSEPNGVFELPSEHCLLLV